MPGGADVVGYAGVACGWVGALDRLVRVVDVGVIDGVFGAAEDADGLGSTVADDTEADVVGVVTARAGALLFSSGGDDTPHADSPNTIAQRPAVQAVVARRVTASR